ncbi:MAG: C40 family peptidase [Sumerlaeia bacterium]
MFSRLSSFLLLALIPGTVATAQESRPAVTPTPAAEIRRGEVVGQDDSGKSWYERRMERAASRMEPSLQGDSERLPAYLDHFQRTFIEDLRFFAFDVEATADGEGGVALTGYAEYPKHVNTFAAILGALGFDPVTTGGVTLLPDVPMDEAFGVISTTNAFLYSKPVKPRETVTEARLGDSVWILREADGHYYVHGMDGYLGWVDADEVEAMDRETFLEWNDPKATRVRLRQDIRDGQGQLRLPAGSLFPLKSTLNDRTVEFLVTPTRGHAVLAKDGQELSDLLAFSDVSRMEDDVEVAVAAAKGKLGTPYVWGGTTQEGVDCSGLVQSSYAAAGIRLPRDADQQSLVGDLVATFWAPEGIRRGDTLFFMGRLGTISHTGMALGDGQFIESIDQGVQINSLNPDDENYSERAAKSFVFARRVVD